MAVDPDHEVRQTAQQRLSAAQDGWLAAVQKHGKNFLHTDVQNARSELEYARQLYLRLMNRRDVYNGRA